MATGRHKELALEWIASAAQSGRSELSLNGLGLEEIPPQLWSLTRLTRLNLQLNELRRLPPEIGSLTNLEHLSVDSNLLDELPPELGVLTRLRRLDLASNRLRDVPPLDNLGELQRLDLSQNHLEHFPAAITRLRSLDQLVVRQNRLTTVPPEIRHLRQLRVLDASQNEIRLLPRELVELGGLHGLFLEGNPLADPLPALLLSGIEDLFAYLRSLGDAREQFEAKILLVGEGEVGKSSLIAALHDAPFVEGRESTHGIELTTLRLPHPTEQAELLLNAWDFGGQEVYRITHQFFFTPRALYMVVWKPRQGQDENAIEQWCRRIRLRVGSEAKILIVATHALQRAPELDYPQLLKKYGDVVVGNHAVDNETGDGITELKNDIARTSAQLPQMGEIVSASWQAARSELLALPSAQIPYAQFAAICARHGLDRAATGALGRMLHHLGHVIHYAEDDGLREVVVLQPEWLTKAISYVLEDGPTRANGGVLDHGRLVEIWGASTGTYSDSDHPYFLRLMEKFDVSYRIPDTQQSLVGQLVPYERPQLPWDQDESWQPRTPMPKGPLTFELEPDRSVPTLSLICVLDEPADGLMAWLTVRHHRFSTGLHWRRGVFVENRDWGSQALLEMLDDRRLSLTVKGRSPEAFFTVLRDGIEYLIKNRWEGLSYEYLVPCRGRTMVGTPCPEYFKFRQLWRYREEGIGAVTCHECLRQFDVGELLTGFAPIHSRLQLGLEDVRERLSAVGEDVAQIKAMTAESANHVRMVLRAVSEEVTDCPRLFVLTPNATKMFRSNTFQLTLWCEHPDHEHPWPKASYELHQAKEWMLDLAPYAALVVKTLQVIVPIAGAVTGVALSEEQFKRVRPEIDLMKTLVEHVPLGKPARYVGDGEDGVLTSAEGVGLKELRRLLFEKDPEQRFGGLRRRQTTAGDFVWICPEHDSEYDPGLPQLR